MRLLIRAVAFAMTTVAVAGGPGSIPQDAAAPEAAKTFEVQVVGKGPAVVLIPGLSSNGKVWAKTVDALKATHECHVVSLAGFGGKPRVDGPFLPRVRDELIAYLKTKKLQKPVLVGHSLGGTLAFWIASSEPDLVGGVVAVDGVPFLPGLRDPSASVEATRSQAAALRTRYEQMSPEQFAQANSAAMQPMVTRAEAFTELLTMANASDPRAVGQAVSELLSNDLREATAKIEAPVLLLASAPWATSPQLQATAVAAYEAQVAKVPKHEVVLVPNARHFVMYDAPAELHRRLVAFLGADR